MEKEAIIKFWGGVTSTDPEKFKFLDSESTIFNRSCTQLCIASGGKIKLGVLIEDLSNTTTSLIISAQGGTECAGGQINVSINGRANSQTYCFSSPKLHSDLIISLPSGDLKDNTINEIVISYTNVQNQCGFEMQHIILTMQEKHFTNSNWMSDIKDSELICDISIPGSHDAASIRVARFPSLYSCQDRSIRDQLYEGIRLFDIRIKVKDISAKDRFVTCHGNISLYETLNEYEPLRTVFDQFVDFLKENTKEAILVTMKIDDWNGTSDADKPKVLSQLKNEFLKAYETSIYTSSRMPTLSAVRGKIYLMNRINNSLDFGVPVNIKSDEVYDGKFLDKVPDNRDFDIWVQDWWKNPRDAQKLTLVWNTIEMKQGHYNSRYSKEKPLMSLNFASGNRYLMGVYIMNPLISKLLSMDKDIRPKKLGWLLFDYGYIKYNNGYPKPVSIVDLIIASNFDYDLCQRRVIQVLSGL